MGMWAFDCFSRIQTSPTGIPALLTFLLWKWKIYDSHSWKLKPSFAGPPADVHMYIRRTVHVQRTELLLTRSYKYRSRIQYDLQVCVYRTIELGFKPTLFIRVSSVRALLLLATGSRTSIMYLYQVLVPYWICARRLRCSPPHTYD